MNFRKLKFYSSFTWRQLTRSSSLPLLIHLHLIKLDPLPRKGSVKQFFNCHNLKEIKFSNDSWMFHSNSTSYFQLRKMMIQFPIYPMNASIISINTYFFIWLCIGCLSFFVLLFLPECCKFRCSFGYCTFFVLATSFSVKSYLTMLNSKDIIL